MNALLAAWRVPLSSRRLVALIYKESLQVLRDPSSLLIAFVLPPILLVLFAFAVSLDVKQVRLGVAIEGDGDLAYQLAAAYLATPYFDAVTARDRRALEPQLNSGDIKGFVVIPANFDELMLDAQRTPAVQIVTDGSQPNTANFVSGYAQGVLTTWFTAYAEAGDSSTTLSADTRFWFNPELDSRRVLLPGAIAIVMTIIGTLLTALVIAREWERGTMEAMMSTPAAIFELLTSKLVPYFVLGLTTTVGCTFLAVWLFDVPLRGSLAALLLVSAVFLVPALGQGLLISTISRNQFVASQAAVFSGFMPAFLLSGFLFEIDSMPTWLQIITNVVPARHYVASLQTIFLAGDVWAQLRGDMLALLGIGAFFFGIALLNWHKRLD